MKDSTISYKHWKTGEIVNKELSDSWPHQKAMDLICPFDDTNLIFAYDDFSKGVYCPNCGIQYPPSQINQDEINKECKNYLENLKGRVNELDETKKDLVSRLEHACNKGLINKANLSEQHSNPIDDSNFMMDGHK
jgi:hypothetical protein